MLRQAGHVPPLVTKTLKEELLGLRRKVRRHLQALDGHGPIETEVMAAVDHAKAPFASHRIDAVLFLQQLADKAQRVLPRLPSEHPATLAKGPARYKQQSPSGDGKR